MWQYLEWESGTGVLPGVWVRKWPQFSHRVQTSCWTCAVSADTRLDAAALWRATSLSNIWPEMMITASAQQHSSKHGVFGTELLPICPTWKSYTIWLLTRDTHHFKITTVNVVPMEWRDLWKVKPSSFFSPKMSWHFPEMKMKVNWEI